MRDEPSDSSSEMLEALRPFAAFYEAMRVMAYGERGGVFYRLESHTAGVREITVEDFARAYALVSPKEEPNGSSHKTEGN